MLTQKEQKWFWGEEQTKAFEALKESLSREPVLACCHLDTPTFMVTDASPVGLGRCHFTTRPGHWSAQTYSIYKSLTFANGTEVLLN